MVTVKAAVRTPSIRHWLFWELTMWLNKDRPACNDLSLIKKKEIKPKLQRALQITLRDLAWIRILVFFWMRPTGTQMIKWNSTSQNPSHLHINSALGPIKLPCHGSLSTPQGSGYKAPPPLQSPGVTQLSLSAILLNSDCCTALFYNSNAEACQKMLASYCTTSTVGQW